MTISIFEGPETHTCSVDILIVWCLLQDSLQITSWILLWNE